MLRNLYQAGFFSREIGAFRVSVVGRAVSGGVTMGLGAITKLAVPGSPLELWGLPIFGGFGVLIILSAVYFLLRALRAAREFKRFFGFLPPASYYESEGLQKFIDDDLRNRAELLRDVYQQEKELIRDIESGVGSPEQIIALGDQLRGLQKEKFLRKEKFYRARDAAQSRYLSFGFLTAQSFEDYVAKK